MLSILLLNPIWITLGPVIVINSILIVSYTYYQIWHRRRVSKDFAGAKKGGSHILGGNTREWWFWTTDPIVRIFVKLRMGPNVLTFTGFVFSCLAGVLFGFGSFGYAGWVMIFGASFDMFDGRVARITGRSSRSGAFFDAVMDRFGEGACLLGLAVYFRDSFLLPIVIIGLVGSLLVSYTKARAEGIGVSCNVGTMQRPERIVYLGVASVLDPMMMLLLKNWWLSPPPILVILALIIIAVMTTGTAVYRMIYVMNKLDTEDKRSTQSLPQIISKLTTPEGREDFWKKARYGYVRGKGRVDHVVLFLMGGASQDLFREFLKHGALPNISKHIVSRGVALNAVSVFPSAMGPTSTPFVTGAMPGTCNIPGTMWFDKTVPTSHVLTIRRFRDYSGWGAYVMDHDLSKSVRTIFEYSRQAVNIFGMLNRGCGPVRDPAFFKTYSRLYNARSDEDIDEALEASFRWFTSAIKRETDFVLYSLPSVNIAGSSQKEKDAALAAFKKIDDYVGRAAELLQKNEMYDATAMMFTGKYGLAKSNNTFDLNSFLSKRCKVLSTTRGVKDWLGTEVISLKSGTSASHLYFKKDEDWNARMFFEDVERSGLVGSLLEQRDVDVLMGRSVEGGIVVQSRRGRAHILEDADGRITYNPKGSDPFGLSQVAKTLDHKTAFDTCKQGAYPDAILQSLQIFRSRRSGDVIVTTGSDVSLKDESDLQKVTSGSLGQLHMNVPFLSSHATQREVQRTVDVFASVLELLGIELAHVSDV